MFAYSAVGVFGGLSRSVWSIHLDFTALGGFTEAKTPDGFALGISGTETWYIEEESSCT